MDQTGQADGFFLQPERSLWHNNEITQGNEPQLG